MKLGLYLRNMGPQSTRQVLRECALSAEAAGVDDVWVADHIAIPPGEAEGSNGRYLDPLATLAFLSGVTERIGLGTGVLVLPYRGALVTAKWVATIQELSGGRLSFGVGAGWMEAEFRAVGVAKRQRGAVTDATLEFLQRCFDDDEVEVNGQRFLFRPRPPRPPLLVGGAPPHALRRAVRFGAGWMPMGALDPSALREPIERFRQMAASAGQREPEVVLATALPVDDVERAIDRAHALRTVGVTHIVHGWRYADAAEFARVAATIGERIGPAVRAATKARSV